MRVQFSSRQLIVGMTAVAGACWLVVYAVRARDPFRGRSFDATVWQSYSNSTATSRAGSSGRHFARPRQLCINRRTPQSSRSRRSSKPVGNRRDKHK